MISEADKQLLANGRPKPNRGSESASNGKELVTAVESILWKAQQKKGSLNGRPQPPSLSNKKPDITNYRKVPDLKTPSTLSVGSTAENSETPK